MGSRALLAKTAKMKAELFHDDTLRPVETLGLIEETVQLVGKHYDEVCQLSDKINELNTRVDQFLIARTGKQ